MHAVSEEHIAFLLFAEQSDLGALVSAGVNELGNVVPELTPEAACSLRDTLILASEADLEDRCYGSSKAPLF